MEIIKLIEKLLSGTITDSEKKDLLSSYNKNKMSEQELNDYYENKWSGSIKKNYLSATKSKRKVWKQIREHLHPGNSSSFFDKYWKPVAGVAAVALIILVLGQTLKLLSSYNTEELIVVVENGQKANITLPDGSIVRMNSATEIRYPADFGKRERKINLNGEAYFEVESDTKRPFIVQTGKDMQVKALGTKFNIKSYPEDAIISSTLLEGKIEVSNHSFSEILNPGEQIRFHKKNQTFSKTSTANIDESVFWMTDQFVFNEESLENIAKILERAYNISVSFEAPEIKEINFSGKVKNNSIENVLNLITIVSPLKHTVEGSNVTFSYK
ncbi:MAG: FecR family protein [Fermentimonas sp.]|nr:FecR family protein [Fermentimonas sp.]